jgi:hypothetical protein
LLSSAVLALVLATLVSRRESATLSVAIILSLNLANTALEVIILKCQGSTRSARIARIASGGVAAHRTVRANLPEPRFVVDDLDLFSGQDAGAGLGSLLRPVPAQVHKHTLKLVAVLGLARNHIDALHEADTEVLEAVEDALSGDVLEDAGNT